MKKYLIFDFDGTIADTMNISLNIINSLAKKYHFDQIKDPKILRNKSMKEAIKYFKISLWKLIFLARKFKKIMHLHIYKIKIHKGMKKTLNELNQRGYKLGLLTSNNEKNTKPILEKANIINLFEFKIYNARIFKKQKNLKKIIKKKSLKKENIIYFGDEVRDIISAKDLGIKIAAVTWGANSKERLKKEQPDYLFTNTEQILKEFK